MTKDDIEVEDSDEGAEEEFEARLAEHMKLSSHLQEARYLKEPEKMEIHTCESRESKANLDGNHLSNGQRALENTAIQVKNIASFEQINAMQEDMIHLKSELAETKAENTKFKEKLTKQIYGRMEQMPTYDR